MRLTIWTFLTVFILCSCGNKETDSREIINTKHIDSFIEIQSKEIETNFEKKKKPIDSLVNFRKVVTGETVGALQTKYSSLFDYNETNERMWIHNLTFGLKPPRDLSRVVISTVRREGKHHPFKVYEIISYSNELNKLFETSDILNIGEDKTVVEKNLGKPNTVINEYNWGFIDSGVVLIISFDENQINKFRIGKYKIPEDTISFINSLVRF